MSESDSGTGGKGFVRDVMRRLGTTGEGEEFVRGEETRSQRHFSTREAIAELHEALSQSGADQTELRRKLDYILAEYEALRRQYQQMRNQFHGSESQNEKLVNVLQESKQQIDSLREEVDKLCAAPNTYAVFSKGNQDGTVEIISDGKPMRVNAHPSLDLSEIKTGQLVRLNEALNVIETAGYSPRGEIAKVVDFLGKDRVIVLGHTDDQKVVHMSEELQLEGIKVGDSLLVDPRTQFATEKMPKSTVEEVVLEEVPDVTYDMIGGLGEQIEILRDSIELPYLYPEVFADYKLSPPKGILLYGPPGCGKTLIAKAVARSLAKDIEEQTGIATAAYFLNVKGPELLNKYVGETEFKIREIFKKARDKANDDVPVVIFFDEMDSLFRQRGSGVSSDMEATVVAQFLSEIDGVESLKNVVVIGATNRQDLIDPAVLRPGRLDLKVKVSRPDQVAAREIFSKYLTQDLPLHETAIEHYGDNPEKVVKGIIDDTIEEMYGSNDNNKFLEVTYAKGEREIFYFKDFASGAMIENIVARAKKKAVKRMIDHSEAGIKLSDLTDAVRQEFKENEDLPNTTNPDDWARISGKKGDRIVNVRTLITGVERKEATVETTAASGQYL
jgi:proteasome-associated ATPase